MTKTDQDPGTFIASREVMHRTGISRATLNNYIRLGIIPCPVVRKPDSEANTKARRMGYFPVSVLNLLENLRQHKEKGYRIKEIQEIFSGRSLDHSETDTVQAGSYNKPSGKPSRSQYHVTEELFPLETKIELPLSYKKKPKSGKASIEIMFKEGVPIPISFSVLCAKIHDISRISAEMFPEDFFKLLHQVWSYANSILSQYFGIYGRGACHGIVYYFVENDDSDYLMNAILAAVELKESMKKLNRELKGSVWGDQDIFLNIGLAEGNDYFGCISVRPWKDYLAMGDAATEAVKLSDFGNSGSIWSTKSLLTRLNGNDRTRIEYGIRRRQPNGEQFVGKRFSRIGDLVGNDRERVLLFNDINEIIVTEIINIP